MRVTAVMEKTWLVVRNEYENEYESGGEEMSLEVIAVLVVQKTIDQNKCV